MQTSAGGDLAGSATPDLKQRVAGGIARGDAVIASLTIVARLFGLIRTLVFSQTVGASCLGTAYVTANQAQPGLRAGPGRRDDQRDGADPDQGDERPSPIRRNAPTSARSPRPR